MVMKVQCIAESTSRTLAKLRGVGGAGRLEKKAVTYTSVGAVIITTIEVAVSMREKSLTGARAKVDDMANKASARCGRTPFAKPAFARACNQPYPYSLDDISGGTPRHRSKSSQALMILQTALNSYQSCYY